MSGPIGSSQWMYSSGAASFFSHTIDQSLRFNDGDSAYLSRTPSSASNRRAFTFSAWIKVNPAATNYPPLFSAGTSAPDTVIRLDNTGKLQVVLENGGGGDSLLVTSAQLRDPSSWYHIVCTIDTTNATADDRIKIYINGTEQTSYSSRTNPSLNLDTNVNNTVLHKVGAQRYASYWDGYMAEVHFLDGLAYDASYFGETKDGVWIPKAYSGSYGTNGFHLTFADSSAIGDDTSGNGNDFTPNNLAAIDVVPDSPTNNWATNNGAMRANITQSEGNLKMVGVGNNYDNMASTFEIDAEDTDGWYWEYRSIGNDTATGVGIAVSNNQYFNQSDSANPFAHENEAGNVHYQGDGNKRVSGGSATSYGDSWTAGDIIGVAVKAGAVYFYKNGTIQNSGTAAQTGITGRIVPAFAINGTNSGTANYGQDSTFAGTETAASNSDANGLGEFSQTVPSGYKALCSANLPDPTIGPGQSSQSDDNFNTVLWSGDGSSSRGITGVGFQPDWVWIKTRNQTNEHSLFDSVRGAAKDLEANDTDAEQANNVNGYINSFDSDGFTVVDGSSGGALVNYSSGGTTNTYVSWNWKAGGSASSNSNGSITSNVSANTDAGFSIGTYTGNATAGATIGHGLGAIPEVVIAKRRDNARDWSVYHHNLTSTPTNAYTLLNSTAGTGLGATAWNNGTFTTDVFTIGSHELVNHSGDSYVFYAFKGIEGFSKFGSYIGNNSTNGPFSFTGFRPAWLMLKRTDSAASWLIYDNKRDTFNQMQYPLFADLANVEYTSNLLHVDFLSNGFKIRNATYGETNASGGTYIYLAFAEAPFKFANAR
jgi:hypothetical protein